ncbi:trimeric intracellular cation channel family protein [Nocardia thailandica]
MASYEFSELFRILDVSGVFVNATLGGVLRQQHFDPIGFVTVALCSGLGGGIIRDTLPQNGPPVVLTDSLCLPIALAGALLAFVLNFQSPFWNRLYFVLDATALGFYGRLRHVAPHPAARCALTIRAQYCREYHSWTDVSRADSVPLGCRERRRRSEERSPGGSPMPPSRPRAEDRPRHVSRPSSQC